MIAPGLTLLPGNSPLKLFVEISPILRVSHVNSDLVEVTAVSGGGGVAIGMLLFATEGASFDLGFFFDGTYGGVTSEIVGVDDDVHARTLRGGVCLGLSMWK